MSKNLVWDYFTQHRRPVAECNLCNEWYHSEQVLNLEKHLILEHPEIITEIHESIRRADLAECFIFDMGEVRCKYTDNYVANIFDGIEYLKDHLSNHSIKDYARALRSEQRNPDQASQSTATEDNASASANKQSTDALSQNTKSLKVLLWANSNNLVWRHFKPVRKFYAIPVKIAAKVDF